MLITICSDCQCDLLLDRPNLQSLNLGHNTVIFIVFSDACTVQLLKMFMFEEDNI